MLRIVPHTVPRVGRSDEHLPDGFELHLLQSTIKSTFNSNLITQSPMKPQTLGIETLF